MSKEKVIFCVVGILLNFFSVSRLFSKSPEGGMGAGLVLFMIPVPFLVFVIMIFDEISRRFNK